MAWTITPPTVYGTAAYPWWNLSETYRVSYPDPVISIDSNCRNCAAPISGDKCDYCGTVYRYRKAAPEPSYQFMACSTGMDFGTVDSRGRKRR